MRITYSTAKEAVKARGYGYKKYLAAFAEYWDKHQENNTITIIELHDFLDSMYC